MRDAVAAGLSGLLVYALLIGRARYPQFSLGWRRGFLALPLIMILYYGRHLVAALASSIRRPPEWDFLCFWLFGRVALIDHNVYDPRFFHALANGLTPSPDFVRELLDVGAVYPPPSILWFLPLGLFTNVHAAIVVWYALVLAVMAAALVVVWRLSSPTPTAIDLLVVVAMAFALYATLENLAATQTIYLALLWVVLALRAKWPFWRGVCLGLALTVKPFLALLLVVPLVSGRWKTLCGSAFAVVVLSAAVLPVIGFGAFGTYVRANPVTRFPPWMYTEMTNQSLLSWILRLTNQHPTHVVIVHQTTYLVLAAAIVALALVLALFDDSYDRKYALLLSTALLVYPQTLTFYPVLLLVPIVILWRDRKSLPVSEAALAAFIAFDVALANYAGGHVAILAIAFMWLALATLACLRFARTVQHGPALLQTLY